MDSFMSQTKTSSDDMLSKAKGWLSGTLKTWASKLDGGGGGGGGGGQQQQQPSSGFHAYHVDSNGQGTSSIPFAS